MSTNTHYTHQDDSELTLQQQISKREFWVDAESRYLLAHLEEARAEIEAALNMAQALGEAPSTDTTVDDDATDISVYFMRAERALELIRSDTSNISAKLWEIHSLKAKEAAAE